MSRRVDYNLVAVRDALMVREKAERVMADALQRAAERFALRRVGDILPSTAPALRVTRKFRKGSQHRHQWPVRIEKIEGHLSPDKLQLEVHYIAVAIKANGEPHPANIVHDFYTTVPL